MPIISFLSVPFFFVCIYPTDTRWLVTNAQSKQRKRISFPKLNYLRLHVWLLLFTMLLYSASPAPAPPFLHLSLLFVWMLAKMFFMSMHAYFYLLSLYIHTYMYIVLSYYASVVVVARVCVYELRASQSLCT